MFEFNGELTGKSKIFLIRLTTKIQAISVLAASLIFLVPTLILSFTWDLNALIFAVILVCFSLLSWIPPSGKQQKNFIPLRIWFDLEEKTVIYQSAKTERFHMISSISKIIDYGEWYHLVFYYSDRDICFVCQKSLITNGTIEAFEQLFEDKIVTSDRYI